jgi:hypothetical protein
MAQNIIPEARPEEAQTTPADLRLGLNISADNAAAQRVIWQANKVYMAGMGFVWSGVTCAYLPFMLPFANNTAYVALAAGAALSLVGATCMAVRLRTIVSQGQDRENLFCRSIYSYERQLRKANSRADDAERQNAILMRIDRRRRVEGETDGDGGTEFSPSVSRFRIPHKGRVQ